jgi:NAD-dependent dihydropyrimidine dehydrogenase PreA subunit
MKQENTIDRKKIPWYPTVDEKECTGCGICVEFCPKKVFVLKGNVSCVAHPYDCVVGCSNCGGECPEGAISFPDIRKVRKIILELKK